MKSKSILLLGLAIGCGLVAMILVQQALKADGDGDLNVTPVLIAITDIPLGTPLTEENTVFQDWPAAGVPKGAIRRLEEYDTRAVMTDIFTGSMILQQQLGPPGESGIELGIPEGMVIISVRVDQTQISSGLISPGSRVDVMVTFTLGPGGKSDTQIAPVMENVEVFALNDKRDTKVDETKRAKKKIETITLVVTREQSAQLKRAEIIGKLHFAMRRRGDTTKSGLPTFEELIHRYNNPIVEKTEPAQEPKNVDTFLAEEEKPKEPVKVAKIPHEWTILVFDGSGPPRQVPVPYLRDGILPSAKIPAPGSSSNGMKREEDDSIFGKIKVFFN